MANLDIVRRRLDSQRLAGNPLEEPEEVVRWLGAVQAQDYPGAKWALAQRMRGATDAALDDALAAGAILRTHVMRPTWHLVTPADIRWMLALTAPRVHALNANYCRQSGLDRAVFKRSRAVLVKALQGGQQLTRAELMSAHKRAGIAPGDTIRSSYLLMHAELDGVICSGGKRGKQFTYALLDERAPQGKTLGREEALAELVKRYFTSHGPATVAGFAWWSGLTTADAKKGLALVKREIAQEVIDGQPHWFAADTPAARAKPPKALLLSNYDEYTINSRDRGPLVDPADVKRLETQDFRLFPHTIVINGLIKGVWRREFEKDSLVITTRPFAPLAAAETRALAQAARDYGEFLNMPVVLQ